MEEVGHRKALSYGWFCVCLPSLQGGHEVSILPLPLLSYQDVFTLPQTSADDGLRAQEL